MKLPVLVPEPLAGAEPVPVQPVQIYWIPVPPGTGEVTLDDTDTPELYQPAPVGESRAGVTVNWYCVFQFHVMLEAALIVKVTEVPVPLAGTLPMPDQPVQTYCVPAGPLAGEETNAVIEVPASNQSLVGFGESYTGFTVR